MLVGSFCLICKMDYKYIHFALWLFQKAYFTQPRIHIRPQNTWLALAKQPDADRSKECYHRRHFFFTENRDLKVVITANRLVF